MQQLELARSLDLLSEDVIESLQHLDSVQQTCSKDRKGEVSADMIKRIGAPFASEFDEMLTEYREQPRELLIAVFERIYVELGAVDLSRLRDDLTPASLRH